MKQVTEPQKILCRQRFIQIIYRFEFLEFRRTIKIIVVAQIQSYRVTWYYAHYKEYEPWETVPRAVEDYPLRKQKLQALGNAVVPACAEFVGLCISRAIDKNTIVFDQNIKNEATGNN